MLPMQSVDLAIEEMRYARQMLGMRGGFLRPNPYHGNKMISDPMYEPFWTMAEELDFSIGFHQGAIQPPPDSRNAMRNRGPRTGTRPDRALARPRGPTMGRLGPEPDSPGTAAETTRAGRPAT